MLQRSPSIGDIYLLKIIKPPFNREAGHDIAVDELTLFISRAAKSQGVKLSSPWALDAKQCNGAKQTKEMKKNKMIMNNAKFLRIMLSKSMTDNNGRAAPFTVEGKRKIIF